MKKLIKTILLALAILCLNACKVVDAQHFGKKEKQLSGLAIGILGLENGLFENEFEAKAQPILKEKLTVNVQQKTFNKLRFKRFERMQGSAVMGLQYIDSLPNKPTFFEVELTDDIAYASAIRENANNGVYAFAKANKDTRVVTKLSLVFSGEGLPLDDVYYLTKGKNGACQLEGVSLNGNRKLYPFSDAVIFDYELSYFCWGTDTYGKINAFDLVEEGKSCKSPLSRRAKLFNKEKNLFNY